MFDGRLVVFTGFLMLISCGGNGDTTTWEAESKLPESFKSLNIEWGEGGGMEYRFEDIEIYTDSGRWTLNDEGNITSVLFHITTEEINGMYHWLRQNRFDLIESEDRGHVDDRGGIHMYVTVDGKRYGT